MYCDYVFKQVGNPNVVTYAMERVSGQLGTLVEESARARIVFTRSGPLKEAHCSFVSEGKVLSVSSRATTFYSAIDDMVQKLKDHLSKNRNYAREFRRHFSTEHQSMEGSDAYSARSSWMGKVTSERELWKDER